MFKDLNPLLHSQLRLTIMSHLISKRVSSFNDLKEITKATSGNLSVQLTKLEAAAYIQLTKSFQKNYPHTAVEITDTGIDAFEEYVKALKDYID